MRGTRGTHNSSYGFRCVLASVPASSGVSPTPAPQVSKSSPTPAASGQPLPAAGPAGWSDGIAEWVGSLHGNWPPRVRAEGSGLFALEVKSFANSLKDLTDLALRVTAHGTSSPAG
jgi:hypothetical protein